MLRDSRNKKWWNCLVVLACAGTTCVADDLACYDQCVPTRPASTPIAPASTQPTPVAAAPPAMFVNPTPSGEVVGASRSFGLPRLCFTLPRISIETPEISLRGPTRGRREAYMKIDDAHAPLATGSPHVYAPLIGGAGSGPAAAPASPTPAAAPAGDTCVQNSSLEVQQLTQQVAELQQIMHQLVQVQAAQMHVREIQPTQFAQPAQSPTSAIEAQYQQKLAEMERIQAEMDALRQEHVQVASIQSAAYAQAQSVAAATEPQQRQAVPVARPIPQPVLTEVPAPQPRATVDLSDTFGKFGTQGDWVSADEQPTEAENSHIRERSSGSIRSRISRLFSNE